MGDKYVQHNPYMPDGVGPTQDYFPAYFEQHPQAVVEIKRVIAEGELVMIHNLWKDTPEDRGKAVVDIFRLENGKIVEHWDVSQDIPENPPTRTACSGRRRVPSCRRSKRVQRVPCARYPARRAVRSYLLLNHGPTVLVTSAHGGRRNVMAAAWAMPLDFNPARMLVVVDKNTHTRTLIDASGEFALCIPSREQAGHAEGRHGFRPRRGQVPGQRPVHLPASKIGAPLVAGCLGWLECRCCPSRTTSRPTICSSARSWPPGPRPMCSRAIDGISLPGPPLDPLPGRRFVLRHRRGFSVSEPEPS